MKLKKLVYMLVLTGAFSVMTENITIGAPGLGTSKESGLENPNEPVSVPQPATKPATEPTTEPATEEPVALPETKTRPLLESSLGQSSFSPVSTCSFEQKSGQLLFSQNQEMLWKPEFIIMCNGKELGCNRNPQILVFLIRTLLANKAFCTKNECLIIAEKNKINRIFSDRNDLTQDTASSLGKVLRLASTDFGVEKSRTDLTFEKVKAHLVGGPVIIDLI